MTSKSLELKSILKWVAGLLVLGLLVIVGWIAWGMGVRWPTVHRVDQPGIPDSIYIKAVDFLDDSGYVVGVNFETCCSDRMICTGPAGKLFDKKEVVLKRDAPGVWVSLRSQENTECPWMFSHLTIQKAGDTAAADVHRFVIGIFNDSSSSRNTQLDPECLKYLDSRYVGELSSGLVSPEVCNEKSSISLALQRFDTLSIARTLQ